MTFTLYPSSPSVAAADAPASPVPTTTMSKRRLFAGFTSLIENLWLSHLSGSGPAGACDSSVKAGLLVALRDRIGVRASDLDESELHRDGERQVPDEDHRREDLGEATPRDVVLRVVDPEA